MPANPIPPTAFDPGQPGAPFTPGDFYQAYINGLQAMQSGAEFVAPVVGPTGQLLFSEAMGGPFAHPVDQPGMDLMGMGKSWAEAPGNMFVSESKVGGPITFVDPSSDLNHLETEQLRSFLGKPMSAWDTFTEMLPQLGSIAAFLGSAGTAGSVIPALASTLGSLGGQAAGGKEGATIGGAVGGLAGGAASGAASGLSGAASGAGDISNAVDLGGLTGASGGTASSLGSAVQGSLSGGAAGAAGAAGAVPSTGASGGGAGPGTTLGTDPSTSQGISGGATGGAQTPGSSAIGTGASDASGAQQATPGVNVFKVANEAASAGRLIDTVSNLVNQPSEAQPQQQAAPAPAPPVTPEATAALPGGAQPVSQIAASAGPTPGALPTSEFQGAIQDFARQQENAIRAQFANRGISNSPMEQRQLQAANASAAQRGTAIQEAMTSAGVSDASVFMALMNSNLRPEQFSGALAQLRARSAV